MKILKGFIWRESERPLTKDAIFTRDNAPVVQKQQNSRKEVSDSIIAPDIIENKEIKVPEELKELPKEKNEEKISNTEVVIEEVIEPTSIKKEKVNPVIKKD